MAKTTHSCDVGHDVNVEPLGMGVHVIEQFQPKSNEEFGGAPVHLFEVVVRISVNNEEEAKQSVQDMMAHSLTTYQTRTTNPGWKRVRCKLEMHCQHYRKPLSKKQKQAGATVQSKCPITDLNRDKKTECSANLTMVVQIPSKKQQRTSDKYPYLLTHGITEIEFHSQPSTYFCTHSGSETSLKKPSKLFFDLFSVHSAATTKRTYEQQLINSAETEAEMQTSLADRLKNPLFQDIRTSIDCSRNGKKVHTAKMIGTL